MKQLFTIVLFLGCAVPASTQGFVRFNNVGIAPVFLPNGEGLGPGFMAELLGPDNSSLATTAFLTQGYFNGPTVQFDEARGGSEVELTVRAWPSAAGDSFEEAQRNTALVGMTTFEQTLGGIAGTAPFPALTGMESFTLIPEPSTIGLAVLSAGFLFLRLSGFRPKSHWDGKRERTR